MLLALILVSGLFMGHDLFLKMNSYLIRPGKPVQIALYNGTFIRSENVITRDRMVDVSILTPRERLHPDTSQWRNDGTRTVLTFVPEKEGTYVIGVSTAPRQISLSAQQFNEYLLHDGVLGIYALREQRKELNRPAREKYSKHVKAVLQAGKKRTANCTVPLGYPVEFVPLQNPYGLRSGDTLEVRFLVAGKPVAGQDVFAGCQRLSGKMSPEQHLKTGPHGKVRLPLQSAGRWYLRTIFMVPSPKAGLDYESKWATLTFEVR